MQIGTVRVMPWGEEQGPFVIINADDFDDAAFTLFVDPLDHDGDGVKGGSVRTRKAKATVE